MFAHLFRLFRDANPEVKPKFFMSDRDLAQIGAIESVFKECSVLLCWWHVVEAWKKHIVPSRFPMLWKKLQALLRAPTTAEFYEIWLGISLPPLFYELDIRAGRSTCAPQAKHAHVEYLQVYWVSDLMEKWSAAYRQDRCLEEEQNTNGIIES